MQLLFGRSKTPAELMREHQRVIQKAVRELERERGKLQQQEKKLIGDIKKAAKEGQQGPLKIMAKDLVRTRRYIQKFFEMKAQLQAVSLRIQTMKSNHQMAEAMKGVTKAMGAMNKRVNLPGIQKIMMEFDKQGEMMDMKEEMMNDAIDDAFDEEDDEEEGENIINQVLDEIGIDLQQKMGNASLPNKEMDTDAELQARLEQLRKS
ncbi:hypothetical protein ROZALSC1DRAFT_28727 [Rozella allomycis CSF55]|uniref:Charged multivesicular body protein 2a-like protein n=1 Tax=Rozella allomycis (strain CSF55) TaxID=988480 RepID=A0A075ASI6_ROZAC|nr:Charged multivesicular body protein 2a-like protein [Rozella allomycis CSF55]RKP19694.1 hypothetical protein ROZALSC1DRAFT_28727 [Rozella allomycis CSF55]|eukprot:EPZ31671.1 Charged multivesicular body protein 2a-like protein [Rozella allomycis CSF55]